MTVTHEQEEVAMALFPTAADVDARIEYLRAHPEHRPPSNTYCRDCRLTGLLHCGEVEYCGGQVSFDSKGGCR